MPLTYHETVDATSTHGRDSAGVTQTKLNANNTLLVANDQTIEDRFEDTFYDAFGSGILLGLQPSPAYAGGLAVDVTAGVALIGHAISISATTVTITASQATGYLYLKQDGTFYDAGGTATPPSACSSFLYAIYTSDGYDCTSVVLSTCGLQLDKIDADVVGAVSTGVIKLTLCPSDRDFFVVGVGIVLKDAGDLSESGDNDYTILDVSVADAANAPVTIFTDQGNRPMLEGASTDYSTAFSGTPDVRIIEAGQVILFEVDAATANAETLGAVLYGRWCDIA